MTSSAKKDSDQPHHVAEKKMKTTKRPMRVLLADDNREMLQAVARILGSEFDVVGMVYDGQALVDAAEKLKPDIGIVDISMPLMNGIMAAAEMVKRGSTMQVIFLTVNEDCDFVNAAFDVGGIAYVIKRHMATDLPEALHRAAAGMRYVSPGCEMPEGFLNVGALLERESFP